MSSRWRDSTRNPPFPSRLPGIAGCYAWMECGLVREYEEEKFVLLLGRVLRLEVRDDVLGGDGALDVAKAKPLMMTGSRKGMNFCTAVSLRKQEPFSAMFPDGKDPLAGLYQA